MGSEDLAEQQQLACLQALMQPLLTQIEQNLSAVGKSNLQNGNSGHFSETVDPAAGLVVQVGRLFLFFTRDATALGCHGSYGIYLGASKLSFEVPKDCQDKP